MYIDDDASTAEVVSATVQALNESARHIGKADRTISLEEIAEVEAALKGLQNALSWKKQVKNASRS